MILNFFSPFKGEAITIKIIRMSIRYRYFLKVIFIIFLFEFKV